MTNAISATTLVADNELDLLKTAQIHAYNSGKAVYIARTLDKKFCITNLIPHCAAWRKDKLEWIRTVLPTEKT
jgi:hypothetical protein